MGDAAAWSALWQVLRPGVRATAILMVPTDDVQDILQAVATAVWQGLTSYRGEASLETWVHRITVRKCLDVQGKGRRRLHLFQVLAALPHRRYMAQSAGREAEAAELAGLLRQCFLALHPTDRAVLQLRYLRDLPYSEVAEALGCSEEAARQRCQRARENLRSVLLQEMDEPEEP